MKLGLRILICWFGSEGFESIGLITGLRSLHLGLRILISGFGS